MKEDIIDESHWQPEEAEKIGRLKGIVEFKIEAEATTTNVEFSEPKLKKKERQVTKIVNLKKNKNALF